MLLPLIKTKTKTLNKMKMKTENIRHFFIQNIIENYNSI